MMRKLKSIVFCILAIAALNAFGSEEATNPDERLFLSVIKAMDQRTSAALEPSDRDLAKRFALELDDNLIEKRFSDIEEPASGFFSQLLGRVGEDTTFRVTYTYPDGNKVDVLRKLSAWRKAEYPEFNFNPPVTFGDDEGPKNSFRIGLEVYPDPDPEFIDTVINALLGVGIVRTNEAIDDTDNSLSKKDL